MREAVHPRDLSKTGSRNACEDRVLFRSQRIRAAGATVYPNESGAEYKQRILERLLKSKRRSRMGVFTSMRHREFLHRNARKDPIARNLPPA